MTGDDFKTLYLQEPRQFDLFARRRYKAMPVIEEKTIRRFWSKVIKAGKNDCWFWDGCVTGHGYAHVDGFAAHRISYAIATGIDPGPFFVCHSCDVPDCTNPRHLWLGTAKDNNMDCDRKGRRNNRTTFDIDTVKEIYLLHKSGVSRFDLYKRFRYSGVVYNIITKRAWRHVTDELDEKTPSRVFLLDVPYNPY